MNCTQACPSLPDPQDTQKPSGPDPRLPGTPSPCTGHSLGEGVALFKVLLPSWGERSPKGLKGPRGPGFETRSSQGCLVMGECLLPCLCTGAVGTPIDPSNPRTLLQGMRPSHPRLRAQSRPPKTTALTRSFLNCMPTPTLPPPKPQGLEVLRQRCPPEAVLLPLTQRSPHPHPPLETGGLPRDPLGHGCQPPRVGRVPRDQGDAPILYHLSLGVEASRAGGTGDPEGVLPGPPMAGCL